MGFVRVPIEISNATDLHAREPIELLADTGAMLSVIPRGVLEHLGIRPAQRRRFRGFGAEVGRESGPACVHYDGNVAAISVIFGEVGDPSLLGVTALEELGYEVDPVSGQLRPTELLMLSSRFP
jgi:predicted aspartyl protease